MAQNCWEFKKCGRQQGGQYVAELGLCPASAEKRADGMNAGRNGGRICWALTGTLCGGKVQGAFAQKLESCVACDFYRLVRAEQGKDIKSHSALQFQS